MNGSRWGLWRFIGAGSREAMHGARCTVHGVDRSGPVHRVPCTVLLLAMRLGIISDTHGQLRPEVLDVFSQVDQILHAGDIGSHDLLMELETLAPVIAVYGNTDGWDLRGRLPAEQHVELEGLNFTIVHGDRFGQPTPEGLRAAYPEADVIVYGHTHRPLLTMVDQTVTVMNPGSAGPPRYDLLPSVGIMELEMGLPPRARLVPLTE